MFSYCFPDGRFAVNRDWRRFRWNFSILRDIAPSVITGEPGSACLCADRLTVDVVLRGIKISGCVSPSKLTARAQSEPCIATVPRIGYNRAILILELRRRRPICVARCAAVGAAGNPCRRWCNSATFRTGMHFRTGPQRSGQWSLRRRCRRACIR